MILPTQPHIENKVTAHPGVAVVPHRPRERLFEYGAATCPRTIDILARFAGPSLDPKYTKQDCADIVAAIRKVWPALS